MEKIVFFGDSYTYGEGLLDCNFDLPSIPPPSKLGWAEFVNNVLDSKLKG